MSRKATPLLTISEIDIPSCRFWDTAPLHQGLDPVAARYRFMPQWLVRMLRGRGILLNRDECRSPMQWTDEPNAGFAPPSARIWLPVHPRSPATNVAAQKADPESLLHCYRGLLGLRRKLSALQSGSLEVLSMPRLPASVVSYRRRLGEEVVDVLLNFGRRPVSVDLGQYGGWTLYSNRRREVEPAGARRVLEAYEGVVLFRER